MKSQLRYWISIIVMCLLLSSMICPSFAVDDEIGYYTGENGRFSVELAENGLCYWYQDGGRYAGRYKKGFNEFDLELIGSGSALDTDFQAKVLEDGSLSIVGGIVNGEKFIKSEKPQEILNIDQLWLSRIRKSRRSTGKISLTETVLLDWEGLHITAIGYSADGNEEAIRLVLENNSADEVILQLADLKINGRSVNPYFYERVGAREKKNCTLDMGVSLLQAAAIETVETISASFDVKKDYKLLFTSDLISIPVQDNRTRVPVLIPLQKTLLSEYHLFIGLIGYENCGTSANLYYYVQNETDNEFEFCFKDARINGKECAPYIGDKTIKNNSSGVYCTRIYNAEYSGIGTLSDLELFIELEGYESCFAEFNSIDMEFERSGQLCGYNCDMETYIVSDFWQENLLPPDEPVENNNDFNYGLSAAKPESGGNESEKYSDDVNRFFSSKAAEAFDYYSNGDRETAKSKFRYHAIFENDPVSKTVLALRYPNSYTDEQRFELIHEAAADGYAPAIYSLALFYEQGVGVEEDKDKANELFRTAADILYGVEYVIDPEVAYTIGQCYEYGDGNFEKDDGKAASLYAHSAMHGESAGATAVGKMIFQERIKSDTEDMVFWFTQAKDASDPEGTFWYAVMVMLEYAEGDVDELMKTAADGGNIQAKLYLESGTLYIFM